jgi:heptosyltransferase I
MNVLIVKTSSLGDIIQAFCVLDYIKGKFPNAQIDWVVEEDFAELLHSHPYVDNAIVVNTKIWRHLSLQGKWHYFKAAQKELRVRSYDVVFDLQGNTKSAVITKQVRAKKKVGFGVKTVSEILNVLVTNKRYNPPDGENIRADYLYLVQQFFGDQVSWNDSWGRVTLPVTDDERVFIHRMLNHTNLQNKKQFVVCYGTRWKNKQIVLTRLVDFLHRIAADEDASFIFVWGNEEEKSIAEHLHNHFYSDSIISEKLSFAMLQCLMSLVDFVIAMDSLPLHLCGTTATPSFSMFGPSSAKKYCPPTCKDHYLQGQCPINFNFEKRCPRLRYCETGACLKSISGEQLYEVYSQARWNSGKIR